MRRDMEIDRNGGFAKISERSENFLFQGSGRGLPYEREVRKFSFLGGSCPMRSEG